MPWQYQVLVYNISLVLTNPRHMHEGYGGCSAYSLQDHYIVNKYNNNIIMCTFLLQQDFSKWPIMMIDYFAYKVLTTYFSNQHHSCLIMP